MATKFGKALVAAGPLVHLHAEKESPKYERAAMK